MKPIEFYAFVEDSPSRSVALRLLGYRNANLSGMVRFKPGFPQVVGGASRLREKITAYREMARNGLAVLVIVDLDACPCPVQLQRDWFEIPSDQRIVIPQGLVFRIAVREIESWVLADREGWSKYIGIAPENFDQNPEGLADPKAHLLQVIARKGRKSRHQNMLPTPISKVGPTYNRELCAFIESHWDIERAAMNSPSLARATRAFLRIHG